MSYLVDVNLYSRKRRVSRLKYSLIVLLIIILLIFGSRFFVTQAFEIRLRQVSRMKGYLFDNTGTYLTGNLKEDIDMMYEKKQEYIAIRNKLSRQVNDLRKHVDLKSVEMDVFRTIEAYLEDENAMKTIASRIQFESGVGNSFYYLIFEGKEMFFPTPHTTPTLLARPSVRGNLDFAELYSLQLVDLEVGDLNE
ncbi:MULTISPECIES: hypothetical protein [Mesotoga]|uniref:hypothetical protein n=2 Tax=Kosmotogaceae TaxID=1643948 RepID=UPI00211EC666|nr:MULTISPECIES: hypothetical protein [Mesotoga]HNQ69977.1 hypothetical protein [Mesotoga prima]HNS74982.1 hypothetical protein [Mesotoga prima]